MSIMAIAPVELLLYLLRAFISDKSLVCSSIERFDHILLIMFVRYFFIF